MSNRFKIFVIIFALCFTSLQAQAMEKVKVAQFGKEKFLLYLPFYIAMEQGYFAKQGIEIDLSFAGNDDQVFAAVASGAVDFGIGDPMFSAIAQERGYLAKTVALMVQKLALTGYTDQKNIPVIKKSEQLAGLRIGSLPKPSTTYTQLMQLVADNQPALADTKIVQAGIGAQLGLLQGKQADIAIDLEPAVSKLEDEGYRVVFNLADYFDPMAITGITTRQDMIDKNSRVVQAVVTGLQQALDSIEKNPAQAVSVAQKLFPKVKPETLQRATMRSIKQNVFPKSAVIPDNYWQRSISVRLASGELHKPQKTNVAVDNQFARQAVQGN